MSTDNLDVDVLEGDLADVERGFSKAWRESYEFFRRLFSRRCRDYHAVFDTPQGRRVLTDLAGYCDAMTTPGEHTHPDGHVRSNGRRDVFVHISTQLHLTHEEVAQMAHDYAKE